MKRISTFLTLTILLSASVLVNAQQKSHDKAVYRENKNEFFEKMVKEVNEFNSKAEAGHKAFRLNTEGMFIPASSDQFTKQWHNTPINQGLTGTCWCFSTTSFFESEIYRLHKKQIKLSELFPVYWEYVEKARRFVQQRGNSEFGEGSEANAVRRLWAKYGTVPAEAYTGMKPGQKHHDHSAMYQEMNNYLKSLKTNNNWNEEEAVGTIKSILNHYLGEPPAVITVDGKQMTPKEYLANVVKLSMDDYVDITSLMEKPYYTKMEYKVPDNWWHDSDYYNVPLDEFMKIVKSAARKGYTMAIGGDVSEPGYDASVQAAIVPSFDIPSEYIDENARQFRFNNETTTDDHGLHLVGYMEKDGHDWYLIKDSGAGAHNAKNKGYFFYHEDYMKLKIMDFMVHKDAAAEILRKFKQS